MIIQNTAKFNTGEIFYLMEENKYIFYIFSSPFWYIAELGKLMYKNVICVKV